MTIEYTPDGTPYLSNSSYLSETPPYTQELAQIIDAGTGGGVCDIKDSKFNDLQPADPISPFPIGMLAPFMGETAPDGWLLCDGRTYDAAYFYALAEANPDFHGDGVFRVPDMRGRAPFGFVDYDDPSGIGDRTGPTRDMPVGARGGDWRIHNHYHRMGGDFTPGDNFSPYALVNTYQGAGNFPGSDGTIGPGGVAAYGSWRVTTITEQGDVGGSGANMPPYLGVNFIVYTGKPTLDINGDILAECGQGEPIAPVTTRMMIESRLAEAGIGEEEIKMLKDQLEEIKKTEAK